MATSPKGHPLFERRALLGGGLATFASLMLSRSLSGCSDEAPAQTPADGGAPDGSTADAMSPLGDAASPMGDAGSAVPDASAGADAGEMLEDVFAPRPMAQPRLVSRIASLGPLGAPDANGLRLPEGFRSRVVARTNQRVAGTEYVWHALPDGGATYPTADGGWIYTSNCEMPFIGGVGAIRFSARGEITAAYPILARTNINCAGARTPWGSWLSCEEAARGRVWECDPWGERDAVVRPALGVFKHEAAAIDPRSGVVYLTEDETDGRLYRFVPAQMSRRGHPVLTDGRLEVAEVSPDGAVRWLRVPDPQFREATPTRLQVPASTAFDGGEGIWWHEGVVYFSTKGTNQVFALDVAQQRITVLYDARAMMSPPLRGVDNITVSCCGDVLVAEDGGTMQVVALLPGGGALPLVQVVGHDGSEVCGPAFDPSGTRLYFSSQRGPEGGWTFEVEGPFHRPA